MKVERKKDLVVFLYIKLRMHVDDKTKIIRVNNQISIGTVQQHRKKQ